jgi:hypothetical protein
LKNSNEQYGHELGPKDADEYQEYYELADQRPTFGEKNSAGEPTAGYNRSWEKAATEVTPQGDGEAGNVIPISGGESNEPKFRRHSVVDKYTFGKSFDPITGRVPDAGKKFSPSKPTGDPTMYKNEGGTLLPTERRPMEKQIQIGWKNRGYDVSENTHAGAPMTHGNTPQRRKLRQTESK